jgi:hypothetical protein
VAQLVEALRYKPEVPGSIPDGVIGNFRWQSFRPHYDPGVDSASNRNKYQKYFLGVKVAGAYGWQPYHLHVLKSGSVSLLEPSGSVQACNGIAFFLPSYENHQLEPILSHMKPVHIFTPSSFKTYFNIISLP